MTNYKIKTYGDILEIHLPKNKAYLLDFLRYKLKKKFKHIREASSSNTSVEYKWMDDDYKSQVKKFVKEFFEGYVKS